MNNYFQLTENQQRLVLQQAAARYGLPPQAVEKDLWVSTILQIVFTLPFAERIIFKGGTSLSKVWHLIDRFSEDIDLAVDNPWWYGEVAQHFDEVKDFFNTQPFAIVECKKQPGDGKLDDKELKWHLRNYGDFLKREIEILVPTMIVCASQHIYRFVLDMFPQEELTSIGKDHNSIRLHKPTGVLIFCSYHPSAYTKSVEE